jgi:hypothetical protein
MLFWVHNAETGFLRVSSVFPLQLILRHYSMFIYHRPPPHPEVCDTPHIITYISVFRF